MCNIRREVERDNSAIRSCDIIGMERECFLEGYVNLHRNIVQAQAVRSARMLHTFMNPGVSAGAVAMAGAADDVEAGAGPGAGPY